MRRFHFALLALVLLVVQPLLASTYYVGSCNGHTFYPTINAALAAAPAGSTVDVYPGTYAEQVVISNPLTLQGVTCSNNNQVIITDVGVTLAATTSIYFGTVAPQVQVTAGPVNITNIVVQENANGSNCQATEIAIFYGSGSSGTVKGVVTNGNCFPAGSVGIEAENGSGATESVTIEDNEIHAGSNAGIAVGSDQVPTSSLTATVKNNHVWTSPVGIVSLGNSHGSISNNFIASYPGGGTGIVAGSCCVPISGNWIEQQNIGIDIGGTLVDVTSNQIFASLTTGINIGIGGVTVKSNGISYTTGPAIEFNCNTSSTVTGNTIIDANVGLDEVPSGFTGSNTFYDVPTIKNDGCS